MIEEEGLTLLGWRDTPVGSNAIGRIARASQPYIEQVFIGAPQSITQEVFDETVRRPQAGGI